MSNKKRFLVTFENQNITSSDIKRILGASVEKFHEAVSFMSTDVEPDTEDIMYFEQLGIASLSITEEEAKQLSVKDGVMSVEEDFEVKILGIPVEDQEVIAQVAAYSNDTPMWNIRMVNANRAWALGSSGNGVNLAILDTGIATHPDLFISGGVSFVTGVISYNDGNGHGTHCAGIAAGLGINNVFGVAKNANLFAVKVLSDANTGNIRHSIAGLEWCIQNKIKVASMSLGSPRRPSNVYAQAIARTQTAGVVVVVAAGNSYRTRFPWVMSPANSFDAKDVNSSPIAVASIDQNYNIASSSSHGSENGSTGWNQVTVSAPGVNVYSTYLNNSYKTMSGTSMACPHIAGLAALVLQKKPNYTAKEVRDAVTNYALPIGVSPYPNEIYGRGVGSAISVTTLECLGSIPNSANVYLNGNTTNGGVDLVGSTDPINFSGTFLQKIVLGGSSIALRCLGKVYNGDYQYLNGNTYNGDVGLASSTDDQTGTHWQEVTLSDGTTAFKCLGSHSNKAYVYLNGNTTNGVVNLAPSTDSKTWSGTHWKVQCPL